MGVNADGTYDCCQHCEHDGLNPEIKLNDHDNPCDLGCNG